MSDEHERLDSLSQDMTPISVDKFEEFLTAKRRKCSGCGSTRLEGFLDPHSKNRLAMFSTLPDQNLARFVPTLPAVCSDCGLISLYWTAVVRRWMNANG